MTDPVFTLPIHDIDQITEIQCQDAINALEQGKVLYYPEYSFQLHDHEQPLLTDSLLDGKHKNISFDYRTGKLGGCNQDAKTSLLNEFMLRYALFAHKLLVHSLPHYEKYLIWGRTSY